ncbi:MAG: aspartate aminotransferase family protein [Acidimicrobiales bacterium]
MTQAAPTVNACDERLDRVIADQERIFVARQPRSTEYTARAEAALAGGVTSNWQITNPQPVWIDYGRGSKLYDVDGNEYVDLHGGYGAALAGHAHPAIVSAVSARVAAGTHFAQPTEDAIAVAENLARRFGLPLWRYANSGTEATMEAVHLMRAITGRELIIKVEGCYHGHHDSVQVSVSPDATDIGPAGRPTPVPESAGIPAAITGLVHVVGFNDVDAVQRVLEENRGNVAGMIVEPIMMNAGIILPVEGYLSGLKELLHAQGALLVFDEVKTGLTAGPGGATALFGVTPDIICLAKAIGGGIACAAIGGTEDAMGYVARGEYEMVGTFSGNPLAMAATRAMLSEVATDETYAHLDRLEARMVAGVESEISRTGLDAYVVAVGAKGCVVFSDARVRDYRGFLDIDDRYNHAHWLIQHNGGVFLPPWGKIEQWLISAQHEEDDVERFLTNFSAFASAVAS